MRYIICLLLVVSTSLSAGSIHKWVDDEGNVHYGDSPPASAKSSNVRVQSAPSNPGKPLPRLSDPESPEATAAANANGGNGSEVSEEQASAICAAAQRNLDVINNNDIIRTQAADGTWQDMTPDQVAMRKAQHEEEVKLHCR